MTLMEFRPDERWDKGLRVEAYRATGSYHGAFHLHAQHLVGLSMQDHDVPAKHCNTTAGPGQGLPLAYLNAITSFSIP